MRRAVIAVLALAGCSSQVVQQIGPHQYMVTAPPKEVWAKVGETCAKLGKMATSIRFGGDPERQLKFECVSPYEIIPIDSETLAVYGDVVKGSYKLWVPTSEIPKTDTCTACIGLTHPPPFGVPDLAVADQRAKQRATDYCAKMNRTMKQTGGGFDIGTGLDVIFSCVP
ncbi:MAG TPA: hypothetical protein VGT07_09195 [Steroidobacteraceae bacterium]|nr:hypothetical protein [Steroidobacteraceae bacterium]